ncbi:hypothetical protein [Ruthenibacterium lactatiformans]|uniref:hypothetical protein n=1 Tax=Ruthenibacterium lactatiformans TaxID=1550024 RepID=UPI0035202D24
MAERESNRRKENTARQGVPVEDMKQFARFLLPKIQVFCPHTRFAGQKNNLYNGKG